jgi:DNA polymerase/3'-5' exonuclease PolX
MALVIAELVLTGVSAFHQQMRDEYPSSLAELGDIPGLTSKHIYLFYLSERSPPGRAGV